MKPTQADLDRRFNGIGRGLCRNEYRAPQVSAAEGLIYIAPGRGSRGPGRLRVGGLVNYVKVYSTPIRKRADLQDARCILVMGGIPPKPSARGRVYARDASG